MIGKLVPALGLALAIGSASGALALESSATTELNVRTGPGNTYGVVGQLRTGETVEVERCATNGWCFISGRNVEGWAFSKYLAADESSFAEVDIVDDARPRAQRRDRYRDDYEYEDYYDEGDDGFYGDPFHQRFGLFFGPDRWRW